MLPINCRHPSWGGFTRTLELAFSGKDLSEPFGTPRGQLWEGESPRMRAGPIRRENVRASLGEASLTPTSAEIGAAASATASLERARANGPGGCDCQRAIGSDSAAVGVGVEDRMRCGCNLAGKAPVPAEGGGVQERGVDRPRAVSGPHDGAHEACELPAENAGSVAGEGAEKTGGALEACELHAENVGSVAGEGPEKTVGALGALAKFRVD